MYFTCGKSYLNTYYDGDIYKAYEKLDGMLWTNAKIKAAFNSGNGTIENLECFIENNKSYIVAVKIP